MNNFNKQLRKHLYIEFRYNRYPNGDKMIFESSWKNKLWEEHGVMNNMDKYCDIILEKVKKATSSWDGTKEESFNITLTREDFNFETFFDTINLPIFITLIPSYDNCTYSGGYLSGKSGWANNNYHVEVGHLTLKGDPELVYARLRIVAAHELTHAYDDYCRRRLRKTKNGEYKTSGDDLFITGRKQGQFIASNLTTNDGKFGEEMGIFMYFCHNAEINAYIGELKEELIPLMVGANNSQDAYNAILQTKVYQNIESLGDTMKVLKDLDTPEYSNKVYDDMRRETLELFNKTRKKDGFVDTLFGVRPIKATKKNPNRDTVSTPVNTYHQMVKILEKKYNRLIKRFFTQASKIAFDIYKKVGDPGTDAGIINR